MLLERMENIETIIQEGKVVAQKAQKNKEAAMLATLLKKVIEDEKYILLQKELLQKIPIHHDIQFNVVLLEQVLKEIENELPKDVIVAPNKLSPVKRSLELEINKINMVWQNHIKEELRTIKGSLQTIKRIIDDKLKITQLLTTCTQLEQSELTNDNYELYLQVIAESKAVINEINPTKAVKTFLDRALSGQATIRDLNPEILEWLKKQNLVDKLKITF